MRTVRRLYRRPQTGVDPSRTELERRQRQRRRRRRRVSLSRTFTVSRACACARVFRTRAVVTHTTRYVPSVRPAKRAQPSSPSGPP